MSSLLKIIHLNEVIYQSSNLRRTPYPIIFRYAKLLALSPFIMRSPISFQYFWGFLVGCAWMCICACVCMCTCTHVCAHVCVVCVTGKDQSMWAYVLLSIEPLFYPYMQKYVHIYISYTGKTYLPVRKFMLYCKDINRTSFSVAETIIQIVIE